MSSAPDSISATAETTRPSQLSGALYVLGAGILWGTTGTTQALAPAGASPAVIGASRLIIGGAALALLALLRGGFGGGRWPLLPSLLAGAGVASYQLCFFAAVSRTGVAVGTLVGIGSSPIIAGVLAFFFRGERPGRCWVSATLLALVGCGLLVCSGGGVAVNALGIILAVAAGASYAGYTVAIKALLPGRTPDAVMAVVFCIGAILLLPLLFTANLQWVMAPKGIATALYLGVIATALSYRLFVSGLRTVPVATAVTLSMAEPLTAALLGVFLLEEKLSPTALCGIPLLFASLAMLALSVPGKKKGE